MTISLKISLLLVVTAVLVSVAAELPPELVKWLHPGLSDGKVNPLALPQWQECDYGTQAGSTCLNCNTRLICTKVGGFLKPCTTLRPYCNNGICLPTPSTVCTPTEEPSTETSDTEEPPAVTPDTEEPPAETPDTEEPPAETPDTEEPPAETPDTEEPTEEATNPEEELIQPQPEEPQLV